MHSSIVAALSRVCLTMPRPLQHLCGALFQACLKALLPLFLVAGVHAAAAATEAASTAVVAGKTLVLGGSGYRYKGIFKVNLIELYATRPYGSLDDLVHMDGPKRIALTVQTEMPAGAFGKSMTRGMEDNVPKSDLAPLVPSLVRMGELFSQRKALPAGTKVLIDFVPGTGTVISINGAVLGEPFVEPSLYRAILSIWLGSIPADHRLKDALLGRGRS